MREKEFRASDGARRAAVAEPAKVRVREEKDREAILVSRQQVESRRQTEAAREQVERERVMASDALKDRGLLEEGEALKVAQEVIRLDAEGRRLVEEVAKRLICQVGEWRVVGGERRRIVTVVTRTSGPVGRERTAGLADVVSKVRTLIEASGVGWDVEAKV